MFHHENSQALFEREDEARKRALQYLAEAWRNAEGEEVKTEALAHAAIFAGLATLVELYGETAICELMKRIPDKVIQGEYTVDRTLQ
ncbi:hypothetical protein [Maritalea porphyrae]|uniref:Uncharacterized protein n=1 Tax=Maritalea porphyrae TaxID=880732 RepID=A0ABQ5URE2_9HYPH|nr:hypothetical protein [Maritalea porphyrae]GLQ17838.1 hypothetical protein GCM10007879_20870 [Maritalea porphyrae]